MKKYFLCVVVSGAVLTLGSESYALRLGAFEVHPFLAVKEQFTDNVFNTGSDEKSDFSTVITPGIQVIFPRVKKKYHLEIIYQADLERFNKFTSENADNHKALGKFELKLPAGLEFALNDEFRKTHDPRGVNISEELDFFKDNFFSTSAAFRLSDRFKVRLDYSNRRVDYEAERNSFRDRTDDTVAGYVYYRFLPKTSAFMEYEYVVIDFNDPVSEGFDSREHHIFGGVTWDVTGKTQGTVKAGYGTKKFKDRSLEGFKGYLMQAEVHHNFSLRHSIKLKAKRETNETNIFGSSFFVTTGFSAEYFHKFTGKLTGKIDLSYARESYRGEVSREDKTWFAGLELIYQMRKWLRAEAGYGYTKRNSSSDDFDYRNSTYFFKVVTTL